MAKSQSAIDLPSNPNSIDSSLWWDPFSSLLTDLEQLPLSSNPSPSPSLVKKLKDNHAWFLNTVSMFKPPNGKSREALNSTQLNIGPHRLTVEARLKDAALKISETLFLDEVQSYILLQRVCDQNDTHIDSMTGEYLHMVLLQYYIERQCLLKCTTQIIMHALYAGIDSKEVHAIKEEALKLVSEGLESKLLSVLQNLLFSTHPEHLDVELFTLWAEETLIEDSLVLDILFLAYYESLCICTGKQWKELCSLYKEMVVGLVNFGKLAISNEAMHSIYQVKVQLLLILIESLNLENLLEMIHDETPFRQGSSAFSLTDIQEMDAIIYSLSGCEPKEAGPLVLTWAVFLCLIQSLPGKEDSNALMEIDHISYVRQAFEAASLSYFLEILQSDILKNSDGPIAGYCSVLRTFISAFIASYEISLQMEDNTLKLILNILCKVYRGEESLCNQFWDRDSITDGPIRCLLCNLEGEFPVRIVELIRFLSALCEGNWSAGCVFNFLDTSVGISTLYEICSDNISQIVETQRPLNIPGVEGLLIPSKTRGHVLRMIDAKTALVRWEYAQSGVLVVVLRLVQELYVNSNDEIIVILDLLCRLISSNPTVCFALMDMGISTHVQANHMYGHNENNVWCRVYIIEIICSLIRNLSPSRSSATVMAMSISIFANMLKCSPSQVSAAALKAKVFEVASMMDITDLGFGGSSSESGLLYGSLAKMLLIDSEQNDNCTPLTISVLDFTIQLVEIGLENDTVLALIVFSLQYIFVNHEYWRYKVKHIHWEVTLKVLALMEKCITLVPYSQKLGEAIRDILLSDSSIHSTLFRVICITPQALEKLYVSRIYELMEIEGLELAICSALEILYSMLSNFSTGLSSTSLPVFHQAVLSSATKPFPVIVAVLSLMSYFRNNSIQLKATRLLSMLLIRADYSQSYLMVNAGFGLNDKQIADISNSLNKILCEEIFRNTDLCLAIIKMLTSAALYQPAFLFSLTSNYQTTNAQLGDAGANKSSLIDAILGYAERSDDLMKSNPQIVLKMLNFLKALWQGGGQYKFILDHLKSSAKFWKQLSNSVSLIASIKALPHENDVDMETSCSAYRFQCHSVILELIAYDTFLEEKLEFAELLVKHNADISESRIENGAAMSRASNACNLKDILASWFESSFFGDLVKLFSTCEYKNEIYVRAKMATSILTVHLMWKLATGDLGCLSVSLTEKIRIVANELSSLPAFYELLAQYSRRGFSEGNELNSLILSDLYYHLQGELEGRKIEHGPFKELSQFLLESRYLQTYLHKSDEDLFAPANDVYLFDTIRLRADLGLDMWDHSEWKRHKTTAEMLLIYMQNANSMVLLAASKLSALRALITVLIVCIKDSTTKKTRLFDDQFIVSCIESTCQNFRSTLESVGPVLDVSENILNYVAAHAELLLYLCRSIQQSMPPPICVLILKNSGAGLKMLSDFKKSLNGVKSTIKYLLLLLISSLESMCRNSSINEVTGIESAEVSNVCIGLLPILCNHIDMPEFCALSLAAMDLIIRSLLAPSTWFPIIQKHLHFQYLVNKLQEKNSPSIPIILKFFLTLARVRKGAEMLLATGFFSSLRALFVDLSDNNFSQDQFEKNNSKKSDIIEKPRHIWGLGLAVMTAIISSLGDSSSCVDIIDDVISYFFSEKAHMISYHLNSPNHPCDNQEKKSARAQWTATSLPALKETEHTLMLMCGTVKHWISWVRVMKNMDSQLREKSIHLLAFISKGTQRLGESTSRNPPLLCPPVGKEEVDYENSPSFIKSRNGWFVLSPLGSASKLKLSSPSENINPASPTYFSDCIALQMYRIAYLLLNFLCLQSEGAAKRAEEVGFVDLAHFPELPMPEILHGLQDQAIAIVTELCEANKSNRIHPEVQDVCVLLLQIMEMSLYLELCVSQICGIRPVIGRIEDFSKEAKLLIKALEGHELLNPWLKSLKQIISLLYPAFLHSEGFV